MPVTLCFDFGNTRKKCGVFEDRELKEVLVMDSDSDEEILSMISRYRPNKAILSSVIEHNPAMETILAGNCRFHKLDHHSLLPLTTPVGKPETIGADRLALVMAAIDLFPDKNNLVV